MPSASEHLRPTNGVCVHTSRWSFRDAVRAAVLVAGATFVVFLPALDNSFVDFDDEPNIVLNERFRGFSLDHLRWMFTTNFGGHYQPLSWLSLAVDDFLWGRDARGYHLTSLLLHAANAAVFFLLSHRLLALVFARGSRSRARTCLLGAGLASAVFALHPLRVESVAWATERRDVLSGFFWLLTVWAYLRYGAATAGRRRWLIGSLAFFALSLLSKAVGMTLPFVLLLLDYHPFRRLGGGPGRWSDARAVRVYLEKLPYAILAAVVGAVAAWAQASFGAMQPLGRLGVAERLAQAGYGVAFYLWKSLWPANLSPIYELPVRIDPLAPPFLLSAVAALVLTAVLLTLRPFWLAGWVAWAAYLLILSPVLGLAQSGRQLVADRYSYLSCLPWALLVGAGLARVWAAAEPRRVLTLLRWPVAAHAAAGVFILAALTWRQTDVWAGPRSLWTQALAVAPTSYTANTGMGAVLLREGRPVPAVDHLRQALRTKPADVKARLNLAVALRDCRRFAEAWQQAEQLLETVPDHLEALSLLGELCTIRDDYAAAGRYYERILMIDPEQPDTHYNLAICLARTGRREQAIEHLREALRLRPGHAPARETLARLLAEQPPGEQSTARPAGAYIRGSIFSRPDR